MNRLYHIYGLAATAAVLLLSGCAESEAVIDRVLGDDPDVIHVGGIENSDVETVFGGYTSRALGDNKPVAADSVGWLLGPLFHGLDITYGKVADTPEERHEAVAILRLLKQNPDGGDTPENVKYSGYTGTNDEKIAEYSFKYRTNNGSEGDDAMWYGNGAHYFQGVYVPLKLRYQQGDSPTFVNDPTTGTAPSLILDQSKQDDANNTDTNYTLLERYLGMPADAQINATVGRVKLPFRHRLARVLAYVLIDPSLTGVTIMGYKEHAAGQPVPERDDAATSEIRFCNVEVLAGVEEADDSQSGHATLTPRWQEARKVIPHFVEEVGCEDSKGDVVDGYGDCFIMFYDTEEKVYIFPTDDEDWVSANAKWNEEYQKALAKYDASVPRREAKAAEDADKASKLKRTQYGKVPCYDLIVRPTYKTEDMVMYDEVLTPEELSKIVQKKNKIEFEIKLSNGLEYTKTFEFDLDANYQTIVYLRINREAIDYNSSGAMPWDKDETYDGWYGVNNQNGNTLSYAGSSWQRAYRLSGHFSQTDNVTDGHYYTKDDKTDADGVQDDDHMPWYPQYVDQTKWVEMFAEAYLDPETGKKGLHHGDYFILDEDITIDATKLPANFVFTGHLDGQDHAITLTGMGQKVVDQAAYDEDNYEDDTHFTVEDYNNDATTFYVKDGDGNFVPYIRPELYTKGDDDSYTIATPTPTMAEIVTRSYYYIKTDEGEYELYNRPTFYVNHIIHHEEVSHTSGSTLFAGLNGTYAASVGEANVHKENGIFVPYVDGPTSTGWRAEVINTKIKGADMFPADAVTAKGEYDHSKVSGYIYNCWKVDGATKTAIKPHTPALPKYK